MIEVAEPHRGRGYEPHAGNPVSPPEQLSFSNAETVIYCVMVICAIGVRDWRDGTAIGVHSGDLGNP